MVVNSIDAEISELRGKKKITSQNRLFSEIQQIVIIRKENLK